MAAEVLIIMPRIDFILWDRLFILKLICTVQMTYSSFITLIYIYLIILQAWTSPEGERMDVMKFKWSIIAVSMIEFGNGILLALAANMRGIRSRRGIVTWIIIETFLIPISISLLKQLFHKIVSSKQQYSTDPHYSRVNIAQVCFLLSQYLSIGYTLDFLAFRKRKIKTYDPNVRPDTVDAPTDPQITTTESRHIRLSQSFLFQPSISKKFKMNEEIDESKKINASNEIMQWKKDKMKEWRKNEEKGKMKDVEREEKECLETGT